MASLKTWTDSNRPARVTSLCLLVLAGCAAQPPAEIDRWSSDRAVPCQSVTFAFRTDVDALKEIVGNNVVPASHGDDLGELHLTAYTCESGDVIESRAESRITVPLDPGQMPLLLAGSSVWKAYVLHISDSLSSSRRLLEESDVAVIRADVWMTVDRGETGIATSVRLTFAAGEIRLQARFDDPGAGFSRRGMLVGTGSRYTVMAGEESGTSYSTGSFSFINNGLTPFSDLVLESGTAELATGLNWDYTLWRDVAAARSKNR